MSSVACQSFTARMDAPPGRRTLPLFARRVTTAVACDTPTFAPMPGRPEPLPERCDAGLSIRIAFGELDQQADPQHPLALLRARRERPGSSAAE